MKKKKVLVVSYYWFPFTGTGTYRISKFVKYLKRLGWEPVILTASQAASHAEDGIDPEYKDLKVYRSKIWEPTSLLRMFSGGSSQSRSIDPSIFYAKDRTAREKLAAWVRLNLFVPDAKIFWYPSAVKAGKKIIRREHPELILSTAPPPTTKLVARRLARWSGLPWLADFRDPWTNIYYYEDNQPCLPARSLNKRLEQMVLRDADAVTVVNHGFFPDTDIQHKTRKITNGFDREDLKPPVKSGRNGKFVIRYMGSLKLNQYPGNFIKALHKLTEEKPEIARRIRLEMYGNIDPTIREELLDQSLEIETVFKSFVPHEEAVRLMAEADMLLMVIGRSAGSKLVLSTKIFEYMMVGRPVLGIGHQDGSAAEVVRKTGIGRFFDHEQPPEDLAGYLVEALRAAEEEREIIHPDQKAIDQYDFSGLTGQLEDEMNKLIS